MNENLQLPTRAVNEWLRNATAELASAGIPSARLDAELILAHTMRQARTYLHAHPDAIITERQEEIANARVQLRKDFVPIAYIIGHKEFYGRRFRVTNATLVPRPETEAMLELLEHIMPEARQLDTTEQPLRLVDVGTGSGIIGITAKAEFPELDVTLLDVSRHALAVTEQNAKDHAVDVTILTSDLLLEYPFIADIVMANLPYVDPAWERNQETNHEPALALFANQDGLSLIRKLLLQTRDRLRLGGWCILEADPRQHDAIIRDARNHGFVHVQTSGYAVLLQKLTTQYQRG